MQIPCNYLFAIVSSLCSTHMCIITSIFCFATLPPPQPLLLHHSPISFCPLTIYFVILLVYLFFYLLWFAPPLIAYFTMPIACLVTYFCQPLRVFIYHQFLPTLPPFFSLSTYCLPFSPYTYFVIMFILNLLSPSTTPCASVGMWCYPPLWLVSIFLIGLCLFCLLYCPWFYFVCVCVCVFFFVCSSKFFACFFFFF